MLLALLLATTLACQPSGSTAFLGLWETVAPASGDGIGHTIELRADGSFVEATTVIVDIDYRLSGDELVLGNPSAKDAGAGASKRVRMAGGKLIEKGPDGSVTEKERLGPAVAAEPWIVGAWRYRHYTGATAFERYDPDGKAHLRIPMRSSAGCYAVVGEEVTLGKGELGKGVRLRFEPDRRGLVLEGPSGRSRLRKDPAGPWYDREHLDIKLPKAP
jgi:hypothetical protein